MIAPSGPPGMVAEVAGVAPHMVIPWALIGTLAAAVVVGVGWARARTGRAQASAALDLAISSGLAGVAAGRAVIVARDAALTGALPPPAAVLTLGSGLSASATVLAASAAAAVMWRRREARAVGPHRDDLAWWVLPEAVAAGLLAWQLGAVVRDEVRPGPPMALVEAASWAVLLGLLVAWPRLRDASAPSRLRAVLGLAALLIVVGDVVRPTLPTPDADLNSLLALVLLVTAIAASVGRSRTAVAIGAGGVAAVALLLVGIVVAPDTPTRLPAATSAAPGMDGAIVAGGDLDPPPPLLDADGLAALVATADGPIVVNLWASWCPPCHAEAPAVARAAEALPDDVTMIGVLVDDDPEDGQAFVDRYGLRFPTALDDGVSAAIGSGGLPTTVVLRADGTVAHTEVGGLDVAALAAAVGRAR